MFVVGIVLPALGFAAYTTPKLFMDRLFLMFGTVVAVVAFPLTWIGGAVNAFERLAPLIPEATRPKTPTVPEWFLWLAGSAALVLVAMFVLMGLALHRLREQDN